MPHEHSLELLSVNGISGHSGLPSASDSEPGRDQPLDQAPLFFAEGSISPYHPVAEVSDDDVRAASRDLLNYVSAMRQRAESICLAGSRSTDAATPNTGRRV